MHGMVFQSLNSDAVRAGTFHFMTPSKSFKTVDLSMDTLNQSVKLNYRHDWSI